MSGICGYVGQVDPAVLSGMLEAIAYRGDRVETAVRDGIGLGYRWWGGRPGKSPGIHPGPQGSLLACCGTLAPPVPSPAQALWEWLERDDLSTLDGAFAAAAWDARTRTLTLLRDPFGVRSLYYVEHAGAFFFASELKQLLTLPGLPIEVDFAALHRYLTFSFVPGESVPVRGVKRLLPGHRLTVSAAVGSADASRGPITTTPWFTLREAVDPALEVQATAARQVYRLGRQAVEHRLNGESKVGLYLSGGIDSSAVAVWLRDLGAPLEVFHLGLGPDSVDRESADQVARHLGLTLREVPIDAQQLSHILEDMVYKLDLPFGDAVCGPHYLLGRAARDAGLSAVFNGEGGDQLFGGWTSKPMVAATLYGGVVDDESPEEQYLRCYHRFYGLEEELYTPTFRAAVGGPGQRRALLTPYLQGDGGLLNRVRLTDIALKGSQNILPRAERLANAHGLDVRVPLFDRRLAELAFTVPPDLKLHGACEKYVLKLAMQRQLPEEVVWRRKFGMSVPVTDWLLGPRGGSGVTALTPILDDVLGKASLNRRGLFRPEYVQRLRAGHDEPAITRRRRLGEKLWALLMLELWMRIVIDGKGIDRKGKP